MHVRNNGIILLLYWTSSKTQLLWFFFFFNSMTELGIYGTKTSSNLRGQ